MFSDDISSIIFMGLILLILLIFCLVVIKRFWIDKKPISFGSQFVGENIYQQYLNEDKKRAIEEIVYQRDEEQEEDDQGEEK